MVTKLAAFIHAYPEISVEFGTCESPAVLIEDGFDLFIHSGDLPDSGLVARRFAQTVTVLVGTPHLVSSYGSPRGIDDLQSIPGIPQVENGAVLPWEFGTGRQAHRFMPSGSFRCGDLEQLRMGVLEHLGIAQAPAWLFAERSFALCTQFNPHPVPPNDK